MSSNRKETFDKHGYSTGTVEDKPASEFKEIYGHFTGNEEVKPRVERVETFDKHGYSTGTTEKEPGCSIC